jgi:hypothetical protein
MQVTHAIPHVAATAWTRNRTASQAQLASFHGLSYYLRESSRGARILRRDLRLRGAQVGQMLGDEEGRAGAYMGGR